MYEIGRAEIEAVTRVIESKQLFRYRGSEGGWCDKFEAALREKIGEKKLGGGFRPIDTGRHVYTNWEPIMEQHGGHCEKLNPFRWAKRKIAFSPDMCPRSLDIMARTVLIGVPYGATVAEARRAARAMARL